MNKLWRTYGKAMGDVKKAVQYFGGCWKSREFAQFLNKFCREFCWGFPRGCYLLFTGNGGFTHRTTITTIK